MEMPAVAETEQAGGGLSRADCLCPICLDIFLEPVTVPCGHSFCKPCFLETVDKANLSCPLCRRRVSSWARLHGRNKTLVNVELWRRVQEAFPTQCQQRLSGKDTGDAGALSRRPIVCQPGELRKEYEDQISRLAAEKRALEEAEQVASEEYIQRLLAEEEEHSLEERRRQVERQMEDDERLARLLSQELNASPAPETQKKMQPGGKVSAKKPTNAGDIERFLLPLSQVCPAPTKKEHLSPATERSSEGEVPPLDEWGRRVMEMGEPDARVSQAAWEEQNDSVSSMIAEMDSTAAGDQADPCSSWVTSQLPGKRKGTDITSGAADNQTNKRYCSAGFLFNEALEEELQSRRQQEEEDWQLALKLQRQLDRENSVRAVDRSKGSADQYQLRQKSSHAPAGCPNKGHSGSGPEEKQERMRVRQRGSSGGCSSDSPLPSVHKASRQTTLTDMFPP